MMEEVITQGSGEELELWDYWQIILSRLANKVLHYTIAEILMPVEISR
jgi:hypothetical protein